MARGGSRNRSGPQPVEGSRTSDRKGYTLTALPPAGYDGEAPAFPLPLASARELEVWAQAWTTPQACAWSLEPWRHRTVALWCRWSVRMEAGDASAALGNVVVRFADQIGLTPAGLKENGWKIADPKPAEAASDEPAASVTSIKDRLNRGSA
jgi:hypothetical protein